MQVKKNLAGPFKITKIRKNVDDKRTMADTVCSIEAGDGSEKPPC